MRIALNSFTSSISLFTTLKTADVDAEVRLVERRVFDEADRFLAVVEHLDAEPQRLQLLDEHLEALGDARRLDVLALHDRLVRLDAAHDVVGLHREELLKDVRRAVGLERPHLHLAEPLAAELCLAAERLLRDERVRARRARVDLVLDEVVQLHHVEVADRDRLLERLSVPPVAERDLPVLRQPRLAQLLLDRRLLGPVKDGRGDVDAERLRGPAELRLALGRDLAHEDVLRPDLGPDVHDPVLVEVGERLLAHVRDVAGDLLGPELGIAGLALVLLDVDGGELVVLDDAIAQDDGVLVVAALPGHERDEDVLAERELALVGRVAVGEDLVRHDAVADAHDRALVEAGALVRADELLEPVAERVAGVLLDPDLGRGDTAHHAAGAGEDDLARVPRGAVLDPA